MVLSEKNKAGDIISAIVSGKKGAGIFENAEKQKILEFAKEFYRRVFAPANRIGKSRIRMYSYVEDKQIQDFAKIWRDYNTAEEIIVCLKDVEGREIVITEKALYFSTVINKEEGVFQNGSIPCKEISCVLAEKNSKGFEIKCNGVSLGSFFLGETTNEDVISLNNFFLCVEKRDFSIDEKRLDRIIRDKIGERIYAEISKEFYSSDELLTYFARGVESLSEKECVICTDAQIFKIDKKIFEKMQK